MIHSNSIEGQGGVTIITDREAEKAITDVKLITEIIMMVRLVARSVDTVIFQIYLPISSHDDTKIENKYEIIEEKIKINRKSVDNVILMSDWNVSIGEGVEERIMGNCGLGIRNVRGQRLINFCQQENYVIANTWNQHQEDEDILGQAERKKDTKSTLSW